MKTLIFDTNEKYEFIYQAMSLSEVGFRGQQLRLVNRIFEKLEVIGKPKEGGLGYTINIPKDSDDRAMGVTFVYPSISFEDAEFDLLVTTFDAIPWLSVGARQASKVYDWLHSIK